MIMHYYDGPDLFAILNIAWPIGLALDPIIYIFLQKDLTSLLKRRVFRMNNDADHINNDAQQDPAL